MAGARRSLRVVPQPDTFAAMLTARRHSNGQTQAQVAELIGVRQQTVAAWERGDRPQTRFYAALVDYLDLTSEAVLQRLLVPAPSTTATPVGSKKTNDSQSMFDAIAQSFAARTKLGPLSSDEATLFRELLAHYRDFETDDQA